MEKLSKIKAPAIAGVIREKSTAEVIAEIKNCMYSGADMIDLHISCLVECNTDVLKNIVNSSKLPILALNYNKTSEWQDANFSEEERVQSFLQAVDAGVAGVDIQGYTFHLPSRDGFCGDDKYSFTKGNPKEVVTDETIISKQCDFFEKVHSEGAEVLLSCHPGIAMNSTQVVELALFLQKRKPDIIKIVTMANNEDEMLEAVKAMLLLKKEVATPVSYHAGGEFGAITRILNPVLGGQIAFCNDKFKSNSTMEQLDLRTTKIVVENIQRLL